MPRGSKARYTDKQKRQAEHIEESAKADGKSEATAERIAWATVNKQDGGGKKSGSGRGKKRNTSPSKTGGRKAAASRSKSSSRSKGTSASKGRRQSSKSSKKS